jgi:putative hemolysin
MRAQSIDKVFLIFFLVMGFPGKTYAMKNPAALYCVSLGYEYSVELEDSGERGVCVLPDDQKAGGWEFLQGKIGQEFSYCSAQGLDMRTVDDPDTCIVFLLQECAVCILDDGTEVEVTELMGLRFADVFCGDDFCHFSENFNTCPADCPSGSYDSICDETIDGLCDPDCDTEADVDCSNVDIDSDAICNGPLHMDYPNCESTNAGDGLVETSSEKTQEECVNNAMREGSCRPNEVLMAYCEGKDTMESCESFMYCNWKGEWCEPYLEKFDQCIKEETINSCTQKEHCVWFGDECTLCIAGPDNCPYVYNPDQFDTDGDGIGDVCASDVTTTIIIGSTTTTTGDSLSTTIIGGGSTTTTGICPSDEIYGEYSEHTKLLKYIRDNVLKQTPEGREIIRLYYEWSPAIVQAMEEDEAFKQEVKEMIDGVLTLVAEEAK